MAILINKNTPFNVNKCIKDKEGRCVIINGVLFGENTTIGCVYAPNVYAKGFFSTLLSDICSLSSSYTILAGDFNCVADPEADGSSSPRTVPFKMTRAMNGWCSDLELLDV